MKDNLQNAGEESMKKLADQLVDYLVNKYSGSPKGRRRVIDQKIRSAFTIGWNCGIDNYQKSLK